jgi:hypothetical protein
MPKIQRTILIAILTLTLCQLYGQDGKVVLTLQVVDSLNKLPEKKDDWFVVNFLCTVRNNSSDTIYFVNPEAYRIFPHPWSISINGKEAEFWPGSIMCAPMFTEEDVIKLAPHSVVVTPFNWHTFVQNFSRKVGRYSAKIRYRYLAKQTSIMADFETNLTDIKTEYSNDVTFRIKK